MGAYLIRRLLLVIPTLWAIITINFFIVQIAPGGPVDQAIAAIEFGHAGGMPGGGGQAGIIHISIKIQGGRHKKRTALLAYPFKSRSAASVSASAAPDASSPLFC